MAICKNCGKSLIIRNGKCVYCGAVPDGDCANNSGQYNGYSQRKRQRYDSKDNKPNLIYQIFLVFMVLAIIIPISFAEYETKNGSWWGNRHNVWCKWIDCSLVCYNNGLCCSRAFFQQK